MRQKGPAGVKGRGYLTMKSLLDSDGNVIS
jgi:hypothetical protein